MTNLVTLAATLTVSDDGIHVDYVGTSAASKFGINVPLSYTTAYTVFGLGCVVASQIPNNAGSLLPLTVAAPAGSILNAPKRHRWRRVMSSARCCPTSCSPACVRSFPSGCRRKARPACGISMCADRRAAAPAAITDSPCGTSKWRHRRTFTKDGLSATAYPSGVRGTPVEIAETQTPLIFWRKELRPDSGGAGRTRGGLGQIIEVAAASMLRSIFLAAFDRIDSSAPRP